MKKSYLIADSGGTKTDWCFVDVLGNKNYFTTASYHPNLMSEEWIETNKSFWKKYSIFSNPKTLIIKNTTDPGKNKRAAPTGPVTAMK